MRDTASIGVMMGEAFAPLFEPYRHKAFFGGRGSGKSHAAAEALTIEGAQQPLRIVGCRQFLNSTDDSLHTLIADKIKAHNMGAYWDVQNEAIKGHLGTEIIFKGLERNPDTIKSLEGADRALVEEASAVSQAGIDFLVPTIRKPGSQIWWLWNPDSPDDPIDNLFRTGSPPPRSIVREVSYLDNPYFHLTEMPAEMEADRLRDKDKYEHIWLGKYRRLSEAAVLKHWRVGRVDTRGLEPLFGLDQGFATDPAAFTKSYIVPASERDQRPVETAGAPFIATERPRPLLYIAGEAYATGIETDEMPRFLDIVPEARSYPIIADSARPELISYMNRHGFPMMRGAAKGPGSVEDGVAWLQGMDILIDPDCPATKREIENYAYKVDKKTKKVLPILAGTFDNIPDSLRYATEDVRLHGERRGGIRVTTLSFGRR